MKKEDRYMKSFSLKLSVAAIALAGIAATSAAFADEESSLGSQFSASLAVASDYRFRGITQNNKEATPEFGLNWTGPEGFYAGTWEAKTDWGNNTPSFETDLFFGKHTDLGGTDLNTEIYYYGYPDYNKPLGGTAKQASFFEGIVQLSHAFGPLTITGTGAYSPEWSGVGGNAAYGEGTFSYAMLDWLSLSANVGYQYANHVYAHDDYVHYDVGATATWKAFSLDFRYVATDMNKVECANWMVTKTACAGGFTALLTYNIAKLF